MLRSKLVNKKANPNQKEKFTKIFSQNLPHNLKQIKSSPKNHKKGKISQGSGNVLKSQNKVT